MKCQSQYQSVQAYYKECLVKLDEKYTFNAGDAALRIVRALLQSLILRLELLVARLEIFYRRFQRPQYLY